MTLVTAGFAIAGVIAMGVPILIHLLARQRRKPIEWAAMRFLIEAYRKHRRRLQLEQLLLLTVRCLILALLGLALARPILESAGVLTPSGARAVYLVIDDGMASDVKTENERTALDQHVQQATQLIRTLGPGDAVGIVTAGRPARPLVMPPSTDHAAIIELLESLTPQESPTDLPGALALLRTGLDDARQTGQNAIVYLMSEFRSGSAELDSSLPTLQVGQDSSVTLLAATPATQAVSNVQIVSIEPVRNLVLPGSNDGSGQVTVRLARTGDQLDSDVTQVRLSADGLLPIEPKTVQWSPGQSEASVDFMINFGSTADRKLALTATIDDDALAADNQRHAVIDLQSQLRVLLIDRRSFGLEQSLEMLAAGQWIRRALEPLASSPIRVVEVEPAAIDLADIRTTDVAILPRPDLVNDNGWATLREFLHRNGLLIVMPPAQVNVHQWTERMSTHLNLPWQFELEVVEHEQGLGLAESQPAAEMLRLISSDLPDLTRPVLAYRTLPLDSSQSQAQPLLTFADGSLLAAVAAPLPMDSSDNNTAPASAAQGGHLPQQSRGLVVYLAVAPELSWTNLPSKPLMVPLFHELVRQGVSVIRGSQKIMVGEQPVVGVAQAARDMVGPQGQRIALDAAGRPGQPLTRSGVYNLLDPTGQPVNTIAVNVDPSAGATDAQSPAAVASWLGNSGPWQTYDADNLAATLGSTDAGSPIAGALLMAVLALVLLETALARWFSHACVTDATGPHRAGVRPTIAETNVPTQGAAA